MITDSIKSKTLLAALLLCVVTIPLSNQLNSISLIIFVAACLLQQPFGEMKKKLAASKFWIVPVIYFLWSACTFFWDTSGAFTSKELERYSILLFLPPVMAMIPLIPKRNLKLACFAFVGVTIIISILCLVKAYIEYQVTGDYRVFYYQYLGEQMNLNAIFLSNYCLASITWLLYYGYVERENKELLHHVLTLLASVFLLVIIFLLSSKLIIFLTILIVLIFIMGLGYIRGYFLRAFLVTLLLVSSGFLAITQLSYLRWRIDTTEFKKYSGPEDDQNGIAIRLFMWETAADLIKERPITGYGLRGARIELFDEYKKRNFDLGIRGFYHSHNQYLESALMAGIPATLILITLIIGAFRKAIVRRNFLLILMVSHFMIQSVFESTFEVQHELVFYLFFIFLFYYHAPSAGSTHTNNDKQ